MSVYVLSLISILLIAIVSELINYRDRKKIFISLITIQLILLSTFRHYLVGADTFNYVTRYKVIAETDWEYLNLLKEPLDFEMGYIYFNKILSFISDDPRFLLFITSIIIYVSLAVFIYNYSQSYVISYFVFISMGYWGNSLNALRQYIAIAIILYSIRFLYNRKIIPFILTVIFASFFHTSALFFIIMYPLLRIKIGKIYYAILIFGAAILGIFSNRITNFALYNFGYQDLSGRLGEGSGIGMIMILISVAIAIQILVINNYQNDFKGIVNLKILHVGILLNILSLNFAMYGRLMLFFTIILVLIIPDIVVSFQNKNDKLIASLIVLAFLTIIYIFWILPVDAGSVVPYTFG